MCWPCCWGSVCRYYRLRESTVTSTDQVIRMEKSSGRADCERVEELLEQAIAAGNPRIVAEVLDGIANMASHRWIRIAPLEPLFGELERIGERASTGEGSGLARGFQRLLELERLGEQGRRELYRGFLKSGQYDSVHYLLTWELAAYNAILEGMDDLLPEIEAAISSNAISAFGRGGLDDLNNIALPLARAPVRATVAATSFCFAASSRIEQGHNP